MTPGGEPERVAVVLAHALTQIEVEPGAQVAAGEVLAVVEESE